MDMKKILITFIMLLTSIVGVWAQETITVTGSVVDVNKEPLVGVNITVRDVAGLGAITDVNGKFKLKMEPYHRLIFSYIGFDKVEVLVKQQLVVNVVMKESSASVLDEVVITGTGAQKKLTVTGAVTTVNVADLKSNPTGSLSNALAGNVAGVMAMQTSGQPGQNTSEFWIRGISTFGAGNSALVLVDGFERSLDEVNVEDIETFTVLKDASTTAIYGARGANGVVLITTKHGKAGKVNINAKVESIYNTRTTTPEFVDGYTYATMINEARATRAQELLYQPYEMELLRLGLEPDLYPNVDWKDVLLKDGAMTYRATLNLDGGGTTARYFVSASYIEEQGMYKTDKALKDYNTNANAKRWNYRLNTDIDVTKTTLLKVGVSGSLKKTNEPGLGGDIWKSVMGQSPISIPLMYSNGYVPAYGTGYQTNPYVLATQTGYREAWENTIQTNVTLEQKLDFITQGLRFVGRFGFDTFNKHSIKREKWPEQWKAERYRDENGEIVYNRVSTEQKELKQSSDSEGNRVEFFEAELHYDRGFKAHHLGGTLKYNQDAKVMTVKIGDDIKNGIARRHQGLAGRVSYNWNYRYFADFNFGYNGSENFATGHQFGFFPAFSLAWNIAEENFIKKHLKWMNMFKLRYSFGKVGNDNLKIGNDEIRFPYLYTIANSGDYQWADYNYDKKYAGKTYTELASNNVTWEIATKHDLGVDLSLFNDKFTATLDYFHEQRDGIFMERHFLPAIVGVQSVPRSNVGSVLSRGLDGNFSFKQNIGKVFLTVRGNMTYSKNEILDKDEEQHVYPYRMEKGHRVDQAIGLISLGLFKDYDDIRNSPRQDFGTVQPGDIKYKDVNGDGIVNDEDQVAIGATTRPNLIYGVGISAQWKGLDVNVHFQGAGKSSFFIDGPAVYAFSNGMWGNILKEIAESDRWISADLSGNPATENPNAEYPRLSYGGNNNNYRRSSYWLRDGSYLRLKTFEVGYSLPKSIVNKLHFNNVRIFFIGNNLLTFSKFKLWDPELGSSNGEQYPLAKSLTIGLSVNM